MDYIYSMLSKNNINDLEDRVTRLEECKVDKVAGKGLSTNDYDNNAKAVVESTPAALENKVDKIVGKGLSENDFTNSLKEKLEILNMVDSNPEMVGDEPYLNAIEINNVKFKIPQPQADNSANEEEQPEE